MSEIVASLVAIVTADVDGALENFNRVDGAASSLSDKLRSAGATLTAGLTLPILGFATAAVKAASDEETQLSQLNAVLKSTGDVSGVTAKQATDLADSLSKVTRFSDESVLSTEDLLLTFTSIGKDVFPDALKATLDMSQALGQDTKSSAIQLGKALQDPVAGLTALKRVGVEFTEAQKEQIKALVKAGDVSGAQKLILQELQREFGGSAVAAGHTFAGQMDILNNKFNEFQEKVGNLIIPVLEQGMNLLSDFVDKLSNLPPGVLQVGLVVGAALAAIGPILGVLGSIGTVIGFILSPIGLLVAAVGLLAAAFATNFGGIRDAAMPIISEIGTKISGLWTQIQPALQNLYNWFVTDGLPIIHNFIQNTLLPSVQNLINLLGNIWTMVSDGLGKLYNWFISDGLPTIKKDLQEFGDNVVKPVFRLLGDIWSIVSPDLQKLFDWIKTIG